MCCAVDSADEYGCRVLSETDENVGPPTGGNDGTEPPMEEGISPISITKEMSTSYLDYAMSVIVSRAIPDVRDGLKPVHRRVLYAMHESGYTHDKKYRKCARVVGDVMGKYHPHGDLAIYDALVRLAQNFSMSLPLLDGQGNFGSVDGDRAAAMRYTEVRLDRSAEALLTDIGKDTVNFQDNYDGGESEPTVLPARFPNMLVNGAGGIAVGMATNIPPHNLGEVVDATLAVIDDPEISMNELLEIVPGPDFPTGGQIIGRLGSRSGLSEAKGSVVMRAKCTIEEIRKNRTAIIVHEIPYQVNKSNLIEKIAEYVRDKKIEGISDLRDESDRTGMRIVIEIKRDANAEVVLNQLYRHSQLQNRFGVNMLALDHGRPRQMNLREMLDAFIDFRIEVIARRCRFDLAKSRDRAHVLVALAVAVANIDEVIALIRKAPDPAAARDALRSRSWPARQMGPLVSLIADPRSKLDENGDIQLTLEQAKAILDLRLQRLTALGGDEIGEEAKKISGTIGELLAILRSRDQVLDIIRAELREDRERFAVPRRTEIIEGELDVDDESLIPRAEMVVTFTAQGYAKRTPLDVYREQRRGGTGRAGMTTKDEDFVTKIFVASTHAPILCFSSAGMVYTIKVWRLPQGDPRTKGKALVNLLPLNAGETITSILVLPEDEDSWSELDVMFATRSGGVRRNKLSDFANVMRNGKIAMKPGEGDGILAVEPCSPADDVLLTTKQGKCIRFPVDVVRVFVGRTSTGVRGIRLADGDEVISMAILRHVDIDPASARAYLKHASAMRRAAGDGEEEPSSEADNEDTGEEAALSVERIGELGAAEQFVLTLSDNGYGKRSSAYEYRVSGRGGKGLKAHNLKLAKMEDAKLAASFPVNVEDGLMLVTDGGQLIRIPVEGIRIAGRATAGVTIIRLRGDEKVVSVQRVVDSGEEEGETDEQPEAGES
ncbi:DNA gyrase subunit A [hydrothermal vent metagenome]|uniref:DNA topoisomerase (ATP-hydrolyzing) n=1 Tax=hydrothermal vent metagenome TaxID=652676 RepID=A0A3B0SKF0_9ZZZZ